MDGLELNWLGDLLYLLPHKAIYRPRGRTLLIADTHFGKAATFRRAGIPIPHGTTAVDLARLDALLLQTAAERLVVLGDFFHAKTSRAEQTMQAIGEWRNSHAQLAVALVRGNHDRAAGDPPASWNFECNNELLDLPFVYFHDAVPDARGYALGGHLHPSFTLRNRTGPPLKCPCFWFEQQHAVLPAFGSFTGTMPIARTPDDRVFLIGPDSVMECPSCAGRNSTRSSK